MQTGELTESVQRRSVQEALHLEQREDLVFSSEGPLPGYSDMPWRQVTAVANSLSAKGASPLALVLQGILPESCEESLLRTDMKAFAAEAERQGMAFCDAGIQVSEAVSDRQYFVTGVGKREKPEESLRVGHTFVLACHIALAGTAALARKYETQLKKRFPAQLIDRAIAFDRFFSVTEIARTVNCFGSCPMQPLGQGGIFRALWEMAEEACVGLEVDLKKIPVKQETVEICEYFDINPYCLYSAGAMLIGTDQPDEFIGALKAADIPAVAIGCVKEGKDRVLFNKGNRRFLNKPGRDEFWRGDKKK